jgi:hypothetical protein
VEVVPPVAQKLQMPFVLVSTQTPSVVECSLAADGSEAVLTFEHPFSIHDDSSVLRGMGLHEPKEGVRSLRGLSAHMIDYARGGEWRAAAAAAATAAAVDRAATAPPSSAPPPTSAKA